METSRRMHTRTKPLSLQHPTFQNMQTPLVLNHNYKSANKNVQKAWPNIAHTSIYILFDEALTIQICFIQNNQHFSYITQQ